jgi:membrane protease YdiL (CAAX protease family)
MLFLLREPLRFAGYGRRIRWNQLGSGFLVGLVLIAAVIGVLYVLGDYVPGPLLLSPVQIIGYGAAYVATMLLVAISEEGLFRGYALTQLSRGISFWPAALLSSVLFGLGHLANGGMTVVGACSVISAGLMLSYAFRRTGAAYFGVGFHAAWDGGTTFLFGAVAVGLRLPNTLFQANITGPAWLTGASAGPIAGVLGFVAFLIAAGVVHACYKPESTG